MELEKNSFRVYERLLSGNSCLKVLRQLIMLLCLIMPIQIIYFFTLIFKFKKNIDIIQNSWKFQEQNFQNFLKNDAVLSIKVLQFPQDLENLQFIVSNGTIFQSNDFNIQNISINIFKNTILHLDIGNQLQLLYMEERLKQNHNFTNIKIFLNSEKLVDNYFLNVLIKLTSLETIFIQSIIDIFNNQIVCIRNQISFENWIFQPRIEQNFIQKFSKIILFLIQNIFGYFLICSMTSLYIYATIICSPAIILIPNQLCKLNIIKGGQATDVHLISQAFPWLGAYFQVLQQNNRQQQNKVIITVFICYLIFMYFIYMGGTNLCSLIIFNKAYPFGINDNFFALIAILQFYSQIFLRTRASMLFFPQTVFLISQLFLFYFQSTRYGYYGFALFLITELSFLIIFLTLYWIEIQALNSDPSDCNTPTINRPRTLYFPFFQLSNQNDLPQIWSMFFPLYTADQFTTNQMAFINRNYILINQILNQENDEELLILDTDNVAQI